MIKPLRKIKFILNEWCESLAFTRPAHWRRVVGKTVFDLTGPTFELRTSRSRDERVTAVLLFNIDEKQQKTAVVDDNVRIFLVFHNTI